MPRDASVEREVGRLASATVEVVADELVARGLSAEVDIAGWPDDDSETSELRITFWRGNNLIDRLETFVFKDGLQMATSEEFGHWLKQSVQTVLREDSAP